MDKDNTRKLMQAMLAEYPDLLREFTQENQCSSPKEKKPFVTTIRTTEALKERLEALVSRLEGTTLIEYRRKVLLADVIRGALKLGVGELERWVEERERKD